MLKTGSKPFKTNRNSPKTNWTSKSPVNGAGSGKSLKILKIKQVTYLIIGIGKTSEVTWFTNW